MLASRSRLDILDNTVNPEWNQVSEKCEEPGVQSLKVIGLPRSNLVWFLISATSYQGDATEPPGSFLDSFHYGELN